MPEREGKIKTVEIACPHQGKIIKALYPCGPDGQYLCRGDGSFDVELVRCSQDEGRCAETLCALHRFNRRGPGTWYPDRIRTMRDTKQRGDRPTNAADRKKNSFDHLC